MSAYSRSNTSEVNELRTEEEDKELDLEKDKE